MASVYLWQGGAGVFADPEMWTDLSTLPSPTHPAGPPGSADEAEFHRNGTVSGDGGINSVSVLGASLTFVGNITTESFSVQSEGAVYFNDGAVVNVGTGELSIGDESSGIVTAATVNGGYLAVQDSDLQVGLGGTIDLAAGTGEFTVGEPA